MSNLHPEVHVLLVAVAGCGSGNKPSPDKIVSDARVSQAFAAAGLRRPRSGLLKLFEKGGSGTGVKEQFWDASAASLNPSVDVELFPTVRQARQAVAVGGNIETRDGVQIPPVGRIANVVVTIYPNATRHERARVLRALASLRKS